MEHALGEPSRPRQEHVGRVDADDLPHPLARGDHPGDSAAAAPDLEHAGTGRQIELVEVGGEHRLLLGVGRPELLHVGESLLYGGLGLLDVRVHVRHSLQPDVRAGSKGL